MVMAATVCTAQMSTGVSGLLHTPTAFTEKAGAFNIGGAFINRHMLRPPRFLCEGKPYDTGRFFAGLSPFDWLEISYSFILMKEARNGEPASYKYKDQMFSGKLRLLREGKWWPAIAVGGNDLYTSVDNGNHYFANYYAAASKHFDIGSEQIAVSLAYRHWFADYNQPWEGLVGGIEYSPSFCRELSAMAEWTGSDINVGLNYLLLKRVQFQFSLLQGRYPSGGVAYVGLLF